jgi:type IV secretion system protein TrbL
MVGLFFQVGIREIAGTGGNMTAIYTIAPAKYVRIAGLLALLSLAVPMGLAQTPPFVSNNPSQILSAFQAARGSWIANVFGYAKGLFGALAVIEFAWSAAVMVLEKADLQSWTSALIRKIMWIGGFYMLLINGPTWIPFIIDSFTQIGQNSSGVISISPSAVFAQGLAIAGALSNGFSVAGFLTQPAVIFSLIVAAVIVVISYAMITIQFLVAIVESYIVVAAGFVFLGFGGSRWTAPYAERYIGLAVSNGTKIMVIYLLIAVGTTLGNAWVAEAQSASTSASPQMIALDVMAAALMYMMLCWQIPKVFSAVLGGSPALSGGDLVGAGSSIVIGAAAVAAAVSGGAGLVAAGARSLSGAASAAGATGASSGAATGAGAVNGMGMPSSSGGPVPPPTSGLMGGSAPNGSQPNPHSQSNGSASTGSAASRIRGFGRKMNSVLPPDHAPHAAPPRMDIDHHE